MDKQEFIPGRKTTFMTQKGAIPHQSVIQCNFNTKCSTRVEFYTHFQFGKIATKSKAGGQKDKILGYHV